MRVFSYNDILKFWHQLQQQSVSNYVLIDNNQLVCEKENIKNITCGKVLTLIIFHRLSNVDENAGFKSCCLKGFATS